MAKAKTKTRPKVSRQRLWQLKKQEEGCCQRCGGAKEDTGKVYCEPCERRSIRTAMKRYYDFKSRGLCPLCGRRKPPKGRVLCRTCVEIGQRRARSGG